MRPQKFVRWLLLAVGGGKREHVAQNSVERNECMQARHKGSNIRLNEACVRLNIVQQLLVGVVGSLKRHCTKAVDKQRHDASCRVDDGRT